MDVLVYYEKSIAAAEWVFACECLGVHYEIIGASIFRFSDEVISRVTEYRSTKETEANQALEHNDPAVTPAAAHPSRQPVSWLTYNVRQSRYLCS